MRTLPRCLRYVWVLLFITIGVCWSYSYTEQVGIETIRGAAIHRAEIYDTALKSELARYVYLPSLPNLNPDTDVYAIAEPNRLEQVLINLIGNALDSMAEAGNVRVHTLTIAVSCEAEHVLIEVRDTGVGISEEVRSHLFEPFFTTKDQGEGLGLGLTISASIIQEFGGALLADVQPDGTVFTVRLKHATQRGNGVQ